MKITLQSKTENPERTCAAAAWVCTHRDAKQPHEFTHPEAHDLVKRVVGYGHEGILEHASFTVLAEGVSRALTHQLVRSRISSYCQQSQRYVEIDDIQVVVPPTISSSPRLRQHFENAVTTAYQVHHALLACGVPAEDARYVLPNATCSNITITMNARAWCTFLNQRLCLKAQWEIRELAELIHKELYQAAPALFSQKLPKCRSKGECMGCGGIYDVS